MRPLLSARPVVLLASLWWALGCDSFVTAPPSDPPPEESCDLADGPFSQARLLTRSEYRRTVHDLLGQTEDPTAPFPHEPEVDGFDNNASAHKANPLLVESFLRAAGAIAQGVKERGLEPLLPCAEEDAVCAELFIEDFGRKAFRRPLVPDEVTAFKTLYSRLQPALGHAEAIVAIVEATLQSPQFLYRVEAPKDQPEYGAVPLGPYEMASRLSYFLWGTMPDEQLLDAAEANLLATPEDVEGQARRLLADQRAHERVLEFHQAWFGLDPLASVARDNSPSGLLDSLDLSMTAFIDGVMWAEGGSISDLFSSPALYVDSVLAPVYDLPVPAAGFERHDLPGERSGILTQPALLTLLANHDQSSPIRRGVFVRDRLLCAPVQAPPPTVDNSPPDPDPTLTTRERFAVHTESPDCANCHMAIDPIGFTFEGFDQLGRARTEEHGLMIDTTGALVDSGDPTIDGPVSGVTELGARLAGSSAVARCVTGKWFTFALGRSRSSADECALAPTYAEIEASGGNMVELLVALTKSPSFRLRSPHPAEAAP